VVRGPMGQHARMRFVDVEGARLSAIGLGCWQFGSSDWGYGEDYARREAGAIVNRALDLGVNLVDTAEIYGFGRSERAVGQALAGRRDQAFVATKLFPVLPSRGIVRRRAGGSMRRLGVEALDLYQLHWPNRTWPLGDTLSGLRDLLWSGAVRHAGVSNYSLDLWRRAETMLGAPLLSNQVEFSLVRDAPARDLVPYAAAGDRVVIAYSPLAQGVLSGRYGPGRRPPGFRRWLPAFLDLGRVGRLGDALRDVGARHGATPSQVALAWVVRHPNTVAIPGASSMTQVEENAAAADLELSDADLEDLRAAVLAYHG
jgi:aryl-alcohol dehydrogenase-like predicted oxidoreductase